MTTQHQPMFIITEPFEPIRRSEIDGSILNSGLMGEMGADNVYLAAYAVIGDGAKRPADLRVGERTEARFSLSGSSGIYHIIRTR